MPEKFKDKYRIPSNRLRGWDYAGNGHYYITIVTADRKRWFGEIVNGEMVLNDWGRIVYDEFFKSFEMRAELFLGAFVLMPDHLHAIVILDKTKCVDVRTHDRDDARLGGDARSCRDAWPCRDARPCVSTVPTVAPSTGNPASPPFQRQPQSISSFVAGFKSATVKRIDDWIDANQPTMAKFNKNNPLWQSNYHDHIIRDEMEYQRIADYIARNPME